MVFLHISTKLFPTYVDGFGERYKGISRPSGLWYGRDLSWVKMMEDRMSWSPQIIPSDKHPLPIYEHVFGDKKLLAKQSGDKFNVFKEAYHFAYSLPIPADAFQPPSYAGDDKPRKIMRITPETLAELLENMKEPRREWYTKSAAGALVPKYPGGADPLQGMLLKQTIWKNGTGNPDDGYVTILKHLLTTDVLDKEKRARAVKIINGDRTVALIDLKSSPEVRNEIARGVFNGNISMDTYELRSIEDLFWQPILQEWMITWGGMDFSGDLFKPEYIQKFPLIHFITRESGVLFKPTQVLGKTAAWQDIAAVISWYDKPVFKDPRIDGIPKYVFGVTTDGNIRVLLEGRKSAGRRRRTRRRVLKNPKTLKKRVRKVVLFGMF